VSFSHILKFRILGCDMHARHRQLLSQPISATPEIEQRRL
jgi:hypothetical protein